MLKRLYSVLLALFVVGSLSALTACGGDDDDNGNGTEEVENGDNDNGEDHEHHGEDDDGSAMHEHGDGPEYTSAYICPMHCEGSGSDQAGNCPACGMDYVAKAEHDSEGGY